MSRTDAWQAIDKRLSMQQAESMNTKPLAHVYVRHSTKAQASGDSHRRQLAKAKEWCEVNGHALKEVYDSGRSAFTGSNLTLGQLGELVESVKRGDLGPTPVLLVESFDRLSRQELGTAQGLFLSLINSGASVVTLATGKTYTAPLELGEIIIALVEMDSAHAYSTRLSNRVRSSVERRKATGVILHNAGSCPPWLAIGDDKKSWVVIPSEAAKVTRIFELAVAGHGPTSIANQLTGEQVPKFKTTEGWSANFIQRLLLDRRVLGEFLRKGTTEWLVGFFPVVVPLSLFARVKEGRVVRTRGAGKVAEYNLLRGLCFDAEGKPLIHRTSGSHGRLWAYLVGRGTNKFRVRYDRVEETTLYALECLNEDINAIQLQRTEEITGKIETVKERLETIEHQLTRLKRVFLSDDDAPLTILAEMKELEAQHKKLKETLTSLELAKAAKAETVEPLPKGSDIKDPAFRRLLRAKIANVISKIVVHKDKADFYLSGYDTGESFTLPFVK